MRRALAGLVLGLSAAGCVTAVQPNETSLRPLVRALTEPVDALARAAGTNQAEAELAYAILARHRLRGVRTSGAQAFRLQLAAASRTTRGSQSIYVPGVNGRPGTVLNVPTTVPVLPVGQTDVIERCVSALEENWSGSAEACGGPALHARLRALWAQARVDPRTTPEALAALTCEPAAVRDVWQAAADAYDAEERDRAATLADRIIVVCGETGPSWRARLLRALVALERDAPADAVRLLGPVPKPGPPSIGGLSSWVAMRAQARLGDWAAFTRERNALMAASERALAAAGRERERFRAGPNRVADYDVDFAAGLGRRARRVFLVTPEDPRADPRAIYLMLNGENPLLKGLGPLPAELGPGWSLQEFRCDGSDEVHRFEAAPPGASPPDAAEVRRLVAARLEAPRPFPSAGGATPELQVCGFTDRIAPGLEG